ncbi:COG3904 family protein [Rhizobium terrae]|uniref:COG3904 family protein n=1 Tax=Rhizobium terrae TaxID=2171756 RepID=UPI000E3D9403|nr:hypothetical protein [Rhizobium terrae]
MIIRKYIQIFLFTLVANLILPVVGSAGATATAGDRGFGNEPMDFALVQNDGCQETCIQWISAEGEIMPDTPKVFRRFLKRLGGRKLPVVFQSYGGDVKGALSIGRIIRKEGLETAVGRTRLKGCPMEEPRCRDKIVRNGWSTGEVRAGGAYCFSACPFAFAGGQIRAAAQNAAIGLHQISTVHRTAERSARGKKVINETRSTKIRPALKKELSEYFTQMGVGEDVFFYMDLASPQGMYRVPTELALKLGLVTKVFSYQDDPGYVICLSSGQRDAACGGAKAKETDLRTSINGNLPNSHKGKDAGFEDSRANGSDSHEIGEDPSCDMLNRAYMRTRNTGRYSAYHYVLDQNGEEVLALQQRYIDRALYSNSMNTSWKIWPRVVLGTVENGAPVFRHCLRLLDKVVNGVDAYHFSAAWTRGARRAHAEVWVAKDTLRTLVVELTDGAAKQTLPSRKVFERFDFSREVVIPTLDASSAAP